MCTNNPNVNYSKQTALFRSCLFLNRVSGVRVSPGPPFISLNCCGLRIISSPVLYRSLQDWCKFRFRASHLRGPVDVCRAKVTCPGLPPTGKRCLQRAFHLNLSRLRVLLCGDQAGLQSIAYENRRACGADLPRLPNLSRTSLGT